MSERTKTVMASMPLVIANGCFKALSNITEAELEAFLSYLVNFLCAKEKQPLFMKPKWWVDQLPFLPTFAVGSPLPYVKDKIIHMKRMVRHIYGARKSLDLLRMSQELSALHSARLKCAHDESADTMTVYKDGTPLVIIPAQNFFHDLRGGVVKRSLESLQPEVTIFKVKNTEPRAPIVPEQRTVEVVNLISDDEEGPIVVDESDDDCVFMGEIKLASSPAREKYLLLRPKLSPSPSKLVQKRKIESVICLSSDEECNRVQTRPKNKIVKKKLFKHSPRPISAKELIEKEKELNRALKKEEEEIKNETLRDPSRFLGLFALQRNGQPNPKDRNETAPPLSNKRWKKFIPDITSVPLLVQRQILPKNSLATKQFLSSYSEKIDEHLSTSGVESVRKSCSVVLKRLPWNEFRRYYTKKRIS